MNQDLFSIPEQIAADYSENALWVAYSGGVDSHVLLHLLASSDLIDLSRLHAIHIDHGLQADSELWVSHCEQVASGLNVGFHCVRVAVNEVSKLGLEAAARAVRYQAIADNVPAGDVVLLAQHQEDQAETFLLQLLRGAGVKGLSGMSSDFMLEGKHVVRPLLAISQGEVVVYAQEHGLVWVEDPSNIDTGFNRNYLRQCVWPLLEARWPSAAKSLSRSATYCAEADALLSELASIDFLTMGVDLSEATIPVTALLDLSPARARNLIRYVLGELDLAMPSAVILQRILDEVCLAAEDRVPVVSWANIDARRYRDTLYFLSPQIDQDPTEYHLCSGPGDILLSDGRVMTWLEVEKVGISEALFEQGLKLGFRQGGETIQLVGHAHHKSLKQLYQEWAIPPWEREHIPLLFCGDRLLAVVGYGFSEKCALLTGQKGYFPLIEVV